MTSSLASLEDRLTSLESRLENDHQDVNRDEVLTEVSEMLELVTAQKADEEHKKRQKLVDRMFKILSFIGIVSKFWPDDD